MTDCRPRGELRGILTMTDTPQWPGHSSGPFSHGAAGPQPPHGPQHPYGPQASQAVPAPDGVQGGVGWQNPSGVGGAPGRPAHGPAEVAGAGGMNTGPGASAEYDEPVSSGSDSHRYVSDSDGWRCQRMHIRPSPRVRTIIVRAWGERVVMAVSIAGTLQPAPPRANRPAKDRD